MACKLQKSYIDLLIFYIKKDLNKAFLAHQTQSFLRQAVVQPLKIIMYYTYTFRDFRQKKRSEIKHFKSQNAKFSYARRHATPETHEYLSIKTKKGLKLSIFSSPNAKFS